jgi:hypothetical protein
VRSDEALDEALALGAVVEGVSVASATEGNEEGCNEIEEESTYAHPESVDVVADDPGGGKEAS